MEVQKEKSLKSEKYRIRKQVAHSFIGTGRSRESQTLLQKFAKAFI
jgi:hypothetical protein